MCCETGGSGGDGVLLAKGWVKIGAVGGAPLAKDAPEVVLGRPWPTLLLRLFGGGVGYGAGGFEGCLPCKVVLLLCRRSFSGLGFGTTVTKGMMSSGSVPGAIGGADGSLGRDGGAAVPLAAQSSIGGVDGTPGSPREAKDGEGAVMSREGPEM